MHAWNRDKGAALNTGFRKTRDLVPVAVLMVDGDGQHLPKEFETLLGPVLRDEADMVGG